MPTFRILNQAPQYLLPDGRVNAGGKLYFYETDLSTPQSTWADQSKSTLNANPVIMDAAGRTSTDVWGDGEYGVVMTDADDVEIWTRNNVELPGGGGTTIPALSSGKYLTNDGSNLSWQDITNQLIPNPSGLNNYVLASDGTAVPFWKQQTDPVDPVVPDPDIVVGTGVLTAGISTDTNKFYMVSGTGTVAPSGGLSGSATVTFATPFSAAPVYIGIQYVSGGPGNSGVYPKSRVSSPSAAGFTASFSSATGGSSADGRSGNNFSSTLTFTYVAIGNRTIA